MEHKEKLNQQQLDNLQMERIDLSQTDWFGQFNDDVLIIHNPRFRGNWEPYILKYVLLVTEPSTCTRFTFKRTPL